MVACEGMPKLWERGWKSLLPENRAQLLEEATTLHSRGELFAKHRGTVPEFPPGEDELAEAILEPAFGGQDGDEEVEEDEVPVFAVLEDDEEGAEALQLRLRVEPGSPQPRSRLRRRLLRPRPGPKSPWPRWLPP